MALADPFDILADFPGWSIEFDLVHRQETSRQANGVTRVKDLGSPIWGGTWQSRVLRANELDRWRARLNALEGGAKRFIAYASSRCRPIAHPGSGALPAGSLGSIASNRKTISVSGLAGVSLKAGDLIQIGAADLHRVVEDASGSFEVRPHIWPGVSAGAAVKIAKPSCLMTIVPGSVSASADPSTGRGAISFQGLEAR
ncbi:hypothetical protein [Tianweitania sediminis]|uniref:Uncharacterized protein n=1 Tax=Tianweitania sediminis TaxID=1502156 RepID=A0A8J7R5X2_9HYPH|nr:hypothetical protein [Tianweitania sediminis]MBP0438417.1 hypothetical protein [Tianweitania sediminis]